MGRGQRVLAVIFGSVPQRVLDFLNVGLDLIFPPECIVCSREGVWMCSSCERSLPHHSNTSCPICGKAAWRGCVCAECRSNSDVVQCVAAFHYNDPRAARMVHALKYGFVTKSAPALASCMVRVWKECEGAISGLCIPVPLHNSRMKERGFNQAELLARECSRKTGMTLSTDVLIRQRATPPQTELTREERKKNIHDAFLCTRPDIVRGSDIVLIDDVYTTCATLQEAARVLKECGARDVRALTFAHG